MKTWAKLPLYLKLFDICLQVAAFICLLICLYALYNDNFIFDWPWLGLTEAPLQILSCMFWAIYRPSGLPDLGRRLIQKVFLAVIITGLLSLIGGEVIILYLLAMLIVGPICGIWYFIITSRELSYLRGKPKLIG